MKTIRSIDRRPDQSTSLARLLHVILAIAVTGFGFVGTSFASDDTKVWDLEAPTPPSRRAEGLAYYDLPMQVRARFDVAYRNDLYLSDALARPYVSSFGPGIDNDRSLESWFALTRALSDRVEIGVVFRARSPLGRTDLFDFERQTVGAMIRIVP